MNIYLGTIYIYQDGYQAAILENQLRAITPELIAGLAPNFNHRFIYLLRIFYERIFHKR
jgi:hypothetical protein